MAAPFILRLHIWKKDANVTKPFRMTLDGNFVDFAASDFGVFDPDGATPDAAKVLEVPVYRDKKWPVAWIASKSNIAIYPYLSFEGFYTKMPSQIDYIVEIEGVVAADQVALAAGSAPADAGF